MKTNNFPRLTLKLPLRFHCLRTLQAKTIRPRFASGNFCVAAEVLFEIRPGQAQKQARLFFGRERACVKSANPGLNARVTPRVPRLFVTNRITYDGGT